MLSVAPAGHNCTAVASASTTIPGCVQIVTSPEPNHTVSGRKPISVTGSSYDVNLLSQARKHHRQIIKPNWTHFSARTLA